MRRNKPNSKGIVCFFLAVSNIYDMGCYQTPFQMKKTLWFDELSDPDLFFPSCPHLHSKDGQYKLNVYTGELYSTKSKKIVNGKIVKEKELKRLWENSKFVEFANRMRNIYFEKYPLSNLPPIPVFPPNALINGARKLQSVRGLSFRLRFNRKRDSPL